MALDIEAILAEAELPTGSVDLCLKGSLVVEYELLEARLSGTPSPTSLADASPTVAIAEEMDALRERMLAYEVRFTLQAMPAREGSDFRATAPNRTDISDEKAFVDAYHAWACELLARTVTEPKLTAEQADQLAAKLSDNQWQRLTIASWQVNYGQQGIPFSAAASALTRSSEPSSRRPPEPESPGPSSLAGPSPSAPSASTPTTDA